MTTERIKEIQNKTAYPKSASVQQALLQVWNECEQEKLQLHSVSGMLPLTKEHQCFEGGHSFYLECEIDNGKSKYGNHKCSRCGHVEPFQYDYDN